MPFGKLNPAVKTAISRAAVALEGSACLPLLLTPLSHAPSGAEGAGVQWGAHSVGSYFWKGSEFVQHTKEWNTFPVPLPFEFLLLVLLVTIDPV